MKLRSKGIPIIFLANVVFIVSALIFITDKIEQRKSVLQEVQVQWELPEQNTILTDNINAYIGDDHKVENIYVTVLSPKSVNAVTFNELNNNVNITNDVYSNDTEDEVTDIIVGEKPTEDTGNLISNGTMEIRGQSSRTVSQKSYKIKVNKDVKVQNNKYIINLNKHYLDELRIRNKLSFDLMKGIDNITSFNTKFVNLYVKDLSEGASEEYEFYGLFTYIEQPNKNYLNNHGLDKNGHFYKAEFFEFYRYEENLKSKDDPEYDYEKFESILETRGSDNHEALIEMLEAVNDYAKDIDDIVNKYFSEENMLTWVAINILMGNRDTSSRNFLLYNSLNSDKWYFIPWDYDKAWDDSYNMESYEFGIANTWGMILFNRYFREPENVEALSNKIQEIYRIVNEENSLKLMESYEILIKDLIYSFPDYESLSISKENYNKSLKELAKVPQNNMQRYYQDIERPLPFYLWEVVTEDNNSSFLWQPSFDLQGDKITYDIIISKDIHFKDIVVTEEGLSEAYYKTHLESGNYYWRVIAKDEYGNWRYSFDELQEGRDIALGAKKFQVP